MTDLLHQYHTHLTIYKGICRKPPDIILDSIHIHHLPEERKQFERRLGVEIDGNLHIYEEFGNREFFVELGAVLCFIPEKYRDTKIIRQILFLILFPKYEHAIAEKSWLYETFHIVIRKLEQDLTTQSSTSFYSEDTLYAFIKTVDIAKILKELIPYLNSGLSKGEIIGNVHYLFSPVIEISYQTMTDIYAIGRIFSDFFARPHQMGTIQNISPILNMFLFSYEYLNLSQYYISFFLNRDFPSNFNIFEKFQTLLAEFPFFGQIRFGNSNYYLFCAIPPDLIPKCREFFHRLEYLKIIENCRFLKINNYMTKLSTSKGNLNGIQSQTVSLEKANKIDIQRSESFDYYQQRPAHPSISQLNFFLALTGRRFLPVLTMIPTQNLIAPSIQRAVKGYLTAHQGNIQPYLPKLYPVSSNILSKKNIVKFYTNAFDSNYLQISPINMLHLLQIYDSPAFSILSVCKSPIIENFFGFKLVLSGPSYFDHSPSTASVDPYLYNNLIQYTWKDYLIGLAALSFEPFCDKNYGWHITKSNLDTSISKYFNFMSQQWDVSQFSFSDHLQAIKDWQKTVEIQDDSKIRSELGSRTTYDYKMLISMSEIRKIIKFYRRIYHQLGTINIKSDFFMDYLKQSLQAHRFLSATETHMYPKPLHYIEKNSLSMSPFLHPMLSKFSRIHIILTSRGLWLHPLSLSSHDILQGLFTIGLIQCYVVGGTDDGVLVLEYLIPSAFYIDPASEFHRLLKKIRATAGLYSIQVLEIETYALSMNEWNLRVENFKTRQFMKFKTKFGEKDTQIPNPNPIYQLNYRKLPSVPPSTIIPTVNPGSIPRENLPDLYAQNIVFDPVINWQLLLFLRHSIYFFVRIKHINPADSETRTNIVQFFQQFPLVEIFTSAEDDRHEITFQIMVYLRNTVYFLTHKIIDFFREHNLIIRAEYVFPYELIRTSPITRIMEISRQNPFQQSTGRSTAYPSQFPIFRYYQQDNCFSPEETVQIYDKYYTSPEATVKNINQIKKDLEPMDNNRI